ncbi:MAG: DnaA ATPase domain-containing protein, partial [Pirellula staleyi]
MKIAHEVAMFEDSVAHSVEGRLRQRIGQDRMDLWFGGGVKWTQIGHNVIRIEVASSFVADIISKMFRDDLQAAILETAGSGFGFQISVASSSESTSTDDRLQPRIAPNSSVLASTLTIPPIVSRTEPDRLDVRQRDPVKPEAKSQLRVVRGGTPHRGEEHHGSTVTSSEHHVDRLFEIRRENEKRWDEYVAGDHNRLAFTAGQMVLEQPGQINPLLIHGPSGTGKSHLAIGLAHKMRMMHRMRRVLILTAEQFTIEYTESARGGGFANFRSKYRDVEGIVIDDIQFFLGKAGTLAELRNSIDMLLREKRQVILVADRGLNELSGLGADLYARLSGGMACAIDPLDAITRGKVLKQICGKLNID